MLVKLLAGLMLVFVLIGATVPAAFAEEATTEAETAAPEQGESEVVTLLTDESVKSLAELLSGNDLARQLFMAAAAYNTVTGTFDKTVLTLPSAVGKELNDQSLVGTSNLILGGTLADTVTEMTQIGTITVAIAAVNN